MKKNSNNILLIWLRKERFFLTTVGTKHARLLWNSVVPAKPATKTFDELCGILRQHFNLFQCRQAAGESLKDYLLDLGHLAKDCKYENVEEQLRDVFVFGIGDAKIQQKLLATKDLTLSKAF